MTMTVAQTTVTLAKIYKVLRQEMPFHELRAHVPEADDFLFSYLLNHGKMSLRFDPTQRDAKGEIVRYVRWIG